MLFAYQDMYFLHHMNQGKCFAHNVNNIKCTAHPKKEL
jgi:hypothetical protein